MYIIHLDATTAFRLRLNKGDKFVRIALAVLVGGLSIYSCPLV